MTSQKRTSETLCEAAGLIEDGRFGAGTSALQSLRVSQDVMDLYYQVLLRGVRRWGSSGDGDTLWLLAAAAESEARND